MRRSLLLIPLALAACGGSDEPGTRNAALPSTTSAVPTTAAPSTTSVATTTAAPSTTSAPTTTAAPSTTSAPTYGGDCAYGYTRVGDYDCIFGRYYISTEAGSVVLAMSVFFTLTVLGGMGTMAWQALRREPEAS